MNAVVLKDQVYEPAAPASQKSHKNAGRSAPPSNPSTGWPDLKYPHDVPILQLQIEGLKGKKWVQDTKHYAATDAVGICDKVLGMTDARISQVAMMIPPVLNGTNRWTRHHLSEIKVSTGSAADMAIKIFKTTDGLEYIDCSTSIPFEGFCELKMLFSSDWI